MYFVSIDAGAQVTNYFTRMLTRCGHCKLVGIGFFTLGRAPRTNETLPNFHEWCRVTRHPRIFHGLPGCQRDTPVLEGRGDGDGGKRRRTWRARRRRGGEGAQK